jgi:very-short-patch-repair endonuclease
VDLYSDAREFPRRLRGNTAVARTRWLRDQGSSERAIRWRTRTDELQHPHHGAYLLTNGAAGPDFADLVRAALAVCPDAAVLGYQTAAALLGFGVVESDNVHIVVPAGSPFPQRPRITAHQSVLPVSDPVRVFGLPCAPAQRCAVDLARTLPRPKAIAVLDACLNARACEPDDLAREVIRHSGLSGVRQATALVPLADGRSQCRQESELRLILYDGWLRTFQPQFPVIDSGGAERYRLDLADPALRLAAEYDGSSHLDRQRLRTDRARHNWLESQGWSMRYFTASDLYSRPGQIVDTLCRARATIRARTHIG